MVSPRRGDWSLDFTAELVLPPLAWVVGATPAPSFSALGKRSIASSSLAITAARVGPIPGYTQQVPVDRFATKLSRFPFLLRLHLLGNQIVQGQLFRARAWRPVAAVPDTQKPRPRMPPVSGVGPLMAYKMGSCSVRPQGHSRLAQSVAR
jgi:hypothetical protein